MSTQEDVPVTVDATDGVRRFRWASIGALFAFGAVAFAAPVFTDDTQTDAVIWVRMVALGLAVVSIGSLVATFLSARREADVAVLLARERWESERDVEPQQRFSWRLRRLLYDYDYSAVENPFEATDEELLRHLAYQIEADRQRFHMYIAKVDELQQENAALRSLLEQGEASADG